MALLTPCLGKVRLPDGTIATHGIPAPRGGCPQHHLERERAHHNRAYDSSEYRAFRAQVLREHRAQYGDWCPGDGPEHPGHASADLTLDHRTALVNGGRLLDPGNARVLCGTRNSALGGRLASR